mmetsp:Transcript_2469/g.7442  ORF Transcript_2469/g.7442 Transcript_2469/m.7442 type:complete len:272 (-) Transcript_2469:789-1604(-)
MSLLVPHVGREVPHKCLALCGHFSRAPKLGVEARARHGRAAAGLRRVRDHGRIADDARPVPISAPAVRTVHEVVAVVHLGERVAGSRQGDLRADARRYFTRKLVPKHHVDEPAPVHMGHDHERAVRGAAALTVPLLLLQAAPLQIIQRLREVRPIGGLGRAHARHQRLQSTLVVAARGAVDVGQGPGLRRDVEDVRLRGEPRARPREAPPPGLGRAPADRVLLALLARVAGLAAAVPAEAVGTVVVRRACALLVRRDERDARHAPRDHGSA